MIRYMLVILCKCTMWCFNKLRKTQWARGYPVGLEQGKDTRVYSGKWEELENFQRSDYHQWRLPVTFFFFFFFFPLFESLMNCGEAQTFIHHQSINERKLFFGCDWGLVFEGKEAVSNTKLLLQLTQFTPHHRHRHPHPSSIQSELFVSSLQLCPVWSMTLQMSQAITKHYARGTITPQLGVTNFAVGGRAERRKAIM